MIIASFLHIFGDTPSKIIFTILVIVALQLLVRGSIERIVIRVVRGHKYASKIDEDKRETTLTNIFQTASAIILWTIGVVVILSELHVHIAALLTGAGVVSVVFGLGAQSAIKDFLAGIFIITENQYRVGDIVTLSAGTPLGVSGVVEDITIRITRLRDQDGNLHVVPNGSAGIVSNLSFQFANVNVNVTVPYETDVDKVERIMNDIGSKLAAEPVWAENIIEPIKFLRVDSFSDSGVTVKALGKVKPGAQWDVAGEFRKQLIIAFEKHHIAFALPQVVVHQHKK